MAGAAAATACEIARRQLKRPAGALALATGRGPNSPADHPFKDIDNIIVTPHVGSRTFESVERQAVRAVTNIVEYLKGGKDFIQANEF